MSIDKDKLDHIVAEAQRERLSRHQGYREQSLRIHPWICGRCGREFTRENLHELTVHHKDHDHTNNPPDGSNWELLCHWCHDNEHSRKSVADAAAPAGPASSRAAKMQRPFAGLERLLDVDTESQSSDSDPDSDPDSD